MDCPLKTNSVYPSTSEPTLVFFVGEAPGEEEDKLGVPFCGKAGRLLRLWLRAFNLHDGAGCGNACLHRPYDELPDGTRINYNRVPTEQEMSACVPILERFIERAHPQFIVFVGGTSAKFLGGYKGTVGSMVGRWKEYKGIPCTVIYHPSALLRPMAKAKRKEWERVNFSVLREISVKLGLSRDETTYSEGPCNAGAFYDNPCGEPSEAMGLCIRHLRGLAVAKIVNAGWPRIVASGKVRSGLKWTAYLREATAQQLAELLSIL